MKRTFSIIMVVSLLAGTLVPAFQIQHVNASVTITIRADGSIDPPTSSIWTLDKITYMMKASISDSIVIERDNIILDGAGYTLQGGGGRESVGIYLSGRSNVAVKNTNIQSFWYGIRLDSCSGNTISNNHITNNDVEGIFVAHSSGNTISSNNISDNYWGSIWFEYSSGNTICHNSMIHNGIELVYSSGNTISGNNLTKGYGTGARCMVLGWSNNNMIYHNNFLEWGEILDIWECATNVWDDGYPSGGNYWGDYAGVDEKSGPNQDQLGSDGIGDTPYTIASSNQDNYPLMTPRNPPSDLAMISVSPIQVTEDAATLVKDKDTAIRVDIMNTFGHDVNILYINVTYDFGNSFYGQPYQEKGAGQNGITLTQGLNRIYIPGGPIYERKDQKWSIREDSWEPPEGKEFFFRWTNTGIDDNIRTAIPVLPNEANADDNQMKAAPAKVVQTKKLRILFVPLNLTSDTLDRHFERNEVLGGWLAKRVQVWRDFILGTYPISNVETTLMWPQSESLSAQNRDGLKETARKWVIVAKETQYDRVILLIKGISRFLGDSSGQAIGMEDDQVPIVLDPVNQWDEVIAHEVGHTYFLRHPHDIGPVLFSAKRYWVAKRQYEVDGNTFMSYRYEGKPDINGQPFPPTWIDKMRFCAYSKYTYEKGTELMYAGDPLNDIGQTQRILDQSYTVWNLLDQFRIGQDPEVLLLSGTLFSNGTAEALDPWLVTTGVPDLVEGASGDYLITLRDGTSNVLGEYAFNRSFIYSTEIDRVAREIHSDSAPFVFMIPYNDATRFVQISNSTGHVLYSRVVSAGAPQVHLASPSGGEVLEAGAPYAVSWNVSDPDGNPTQCMVAYSVDNGQNWIPMAINMNQTSFTWDTGSLQKGSLYLVKVTASDGVNAGVDVSDAAFTVRTHEISVPNAGHSKATVGQGCHLRINATVKNEGGFAESFSVSAFAVNETGSYIIGSLSVTLNIGENKTMTFVWDATGFAIGNYTIRLVADSVMFEANTDDNTLVDGVVRVWLAGDVSEDGYVGIDDIFMIASHFGQEPSDPGWNIAYDLHDDDYVGIDDIFTAAQHFGEQENP